ncbi:hypothetical protein [Paenibacillus rigui]|uniref:SLH domain-containing protein n=1 Tax=Paenibacillus rigui TaxID=554312 RepID=A0A229UG32_9BACL|nr:hypothetical protein [Paenibacillus rigui]OXM82343.1 hypothetical protein CF651_31405 [Paenibacillus rigui]
MKASHRFHSHSKLAASFALSGALLLSALAPASAHEEGALAANQPSSSEYKQYLQDNYKIALPSSLSRGEFIRDVAQVLQLQPAGTDNKFDDLQPADPVFKSALALSEKGILTSSSVAAEGPLTEEAAVFIALKAAELKELAYTYPDAKISAALAKIHVSYPEGNGSGLTRQAAQELAAAVDTGLLPSEWHDTFQLGQPASDELAADLLGGVLSFKGEYKNYLGTVNEPDIYSKLYKAYKAEDLIQVKELQSIVDEALKQNLVTGYNLKDTRYNANFDTKLSLTYGHDDITHAVQLIGLLRSEGIDAKVQLEPKTSAFIYLKEWGEPKQTDSYKVVQIENGNYIAYAKEYDIAFEFATAEQKAKFQDVIFQYAKKNSENATGLIASSWWQPLYYSLTEIKDYKEIANNKITKGHYYAQSFSLTDKTADIAAGFKKLSPDTQVTSYHFWVDAPFYNYLLGDYK